MLELPMRSSVIARVLQVLLGGASVGVVGCFVWPLLGSDTPSTSLGVILLGWGLAIAVAALEGRAPREEGG